MGPDQRLPPEPQRRAGQRLTRRHYAFAQAVTGGSGGIATDWAYHGIGLAIGVEISGDGTADPDPTTTHEIVEAMWRDGVLICTTGRHSNTLKIRPPQGFRRAHPHHPVETVANVIETAWMRPKST